MTKDMLVFPINVRDTNIMYAVIGECKNLILVDPIDPEKVCKVLEKHNIEYTSAISLTTHGHEDHNSGNPLLSKHFQDIVIYAGSNRSYKHKTCKDGEEIVHGDIVVRCISTPCHTTDSFCFYLTQKYTNDAHIFVGDTLFYLGCGKFFEGNAQMMQSSLEKISGIPPHTIVRYGHDYKRPNLAFLKTVLGSVEDPEPENTFLTVGQEKKHNPFINTELLSRISEFTPLTSTERLALLRRKKDLYKLSQSRKIPV